MELENYKNRYNILLKREYELRKFIDGNASYEDRKKKLPEWENVSNKLNSILRYFPEATSKEVLNGFKSVRNDNKGAELSDLDKLNKCIV